MFNVCAYEKWISEVDWASADVGMDPNAVVYPYSLTVREIIDHAAAGLSGMTEGDITHVLAGKDLLDMMNNTEHNGYEAFMNPDFNPRACSTCLLVGDWLLSVNGGRYLHDMFIITQSASGELTGTGGYSSTGPPYNDGYDLTLTGQLTGTNVIMTIKYTNGYTTTISGNIDSGCDSMSGGAGTGGVLNWLATRL